MSQFTAAESVRRETTLHLDGEWPGDAHWVPLDDIGALKRWRVADARQDRAWLLVTATSPDALARLDREYAVAPYLDGEWAALPRALITTRVGATLIIDDSEGLPLSNLTRSPLTIERFLRIATAAASALNDAHRAGLLHNDIRPEHLLVYRDDTVRLTGFAQASLEGSSATARGDAIPPTVAYLAPERAIQLSRLPSRQSDLYALGVTFFQLLTGRLPFDNHDLTASLHGHIAQEATPVTECRHDLPIALGQLIARLLSKRPEQRPASACMLEAELKRHLEDWRRQPLQEPATTGAPRLSDPSLIGRETEVSRLRDTLARLEDGHGGILLIQGEAGMGKTTLIRALAQSSATSSHLLAFGKCECLEHNFPYAVLAEALSALCEKLAQGTSLERRYWRQRLQTAIGEQGSVLSRLIPSLDPLAGPFSESAVPPVSEARRHLHRALQCLIGAFAADAHPLVLVLDDVQWIDRETLDFLKELDPQSFSDLLLIATYRPESLDSNIALQSFIQHCRQLPFGAEEMTVGPLTMQSATTLLAQEFDLEADERALLTRHLAQGDPKSPLYLHQTIAVLRETRAVPATTGSNLDALMRSRFNRLDVRTLDLLSLLALMGNQTPTSDLATVSGLSVRSVLDRLRPALQADLIHEHRRCLFFSHDTVGEAASARLEQASRRALRLHVALSLASTLAPDAEAEAVFRAASQLLQTSFTDIALSTRPALIDLLVHAATLAKAASAASRALDYLRFAAQLRQGLTGPESEPGHAVCMLYAQCLVLTADYVEAEIYIGFRLSVAEQPTQRSELCRLRCEIHTLRGDYASVVRTVNESLASLEGANLPALTAEAAARAWQDVKDALGGRPLSAFMTLPPLDNPQVQARLELLSAIVVPGSFCEPNLMLIASSQIVCLTLSHGLSGPSLLGLAWLGVSIADHFAAYADGAAFSQLAVTLSERPAFATCRGIALVALEQVGAWTRPLPFALECVESAYRVNLTQGSPCFACFAINHIVSDLLVMGAPIERMLRQIDIGLALARNLEFGDAQNILYVQALYIRRLAGYAHGEDAAHPIPAPDELARRVAASQMGPLRFWWELFEGLNCLFKDAQRDAANHFDNAWALSWSAPAHIHLIDLALFSVLNRAALERQTGIAQDYRFPMQHLERAARNNPRYFADRLALAKAEIHDVRGESLDAVRQYECAIESASQCGSLHIQGLTHEMQSRCLMSLGIKFGTQANLKTARDAWRRWGAHRLADRLEAAHDFLLETPMEPLSEASSNPIDRDMLAITKACQALSREIEQDALIDTLLTNATAHAGATYSALVLIQEQRPVVVATAAATPRGIEVTQEQTDGAEAIPAGVMQHALEQRTALVIDGAESLRRFTDDRYLLRLEHASIACVPLIKQADIVGLLYLENTLSAGVFAPERIDLLALLAAQAAISLGNAGLYRALARENERRRLSESSLTRTQAMLAIGQTVSHYSTFAWRPSRNELLWTPSLLSELGLFTLDNHGALTRLPTAESLAHPDDRSRVKETLERAIQDHHAFRVSFRTIPLSDGPHDLEMAGEPDTEGFIGVVLDITKRRQTEIALREARHELERTAQATILGELTASIAHEVNQPLASILSNAAASIRWLDRPQPQLEDALEGMRDILSEGQRAAGIIAAMRSLASQTTPSCEVIAMDDVIRHVVSIIRAELQDLGISVALDLAPNLLAEGETIQIQQVLHNLMINASDAMKGLPSNRRHLSVLARAVGREILVVVEDSGAGVSSEEETLIFQAFYSTKSTGMGMGLAICASIITAHRGHLRLTRGRDGETLFFFTLPQPAGATSSAA